MDGQVPGGTVLYGGRSGGTTASSEHPRRKQDARAMWKHRLQWRRRRVDGRKEGRMSDFQG